MSNSLIPNSLIFVAIASYRDPQLAPTIRDCIAKADDPDGLRFGICWQRDAADADLPYRNDPRFRVLDVDWRQSRGACWARAECMRLWQDEDWYLQVDSHCRFAQGWDRKLLQAVVEAGSAKPILSTYGTAFTPAQTAGEREYLHDVPLQIGLQGFTREGLPQLKPSPLAEPARSGHPVRARFLAGGFLFTLGDFVEEVPYDPELYFMGEETAMTLRAFTHGYDLFHPSRTVVWHDYIRADAKKHWADHVDPAAVERVWSDRDTESRNKVLRLLGGEAVDGYGLGTERTIAEYEAYAGISFRRRRAQQYTMRGQPPPNPPAPPDWAESIYPWIAKFTVNPAELPEGSLDDALLWAAGVYDAEGIEIYRRDFDAAELQQQLHAGATEIHVVVEFASATPPASWAVWPVSRSRGWLAKIEGPLQDGDFTLLEEDEAIDTAEHT